MCTTKFESMSSSAAITHDTDSSDNKEANDALATDTHEGPASDDPTTEHVSKTEAKNTAQRNTDTSVGITAAGDSGSGEGARDEKQATATPKHPNGIKQARRDKRKAGWERKKALAKEAKKAKREERCTHNLLYCPVSAMYRHNVVQWYGIRYLLLFFNVVILGIG